MSKNILVLGGTGVIGTELIKDFKNKGHFVVNVSKNNVSPYADLNYKIDLSHSVGVGTDINWDEIFMLSSYSTLDKMDLAYFENERENIKYLLKSNPRVKFYYISSYAVLDKTNYPTDSIRYQYRRSKLLAEKLLTVMHATGHTVHSLRIPAVYGGENNNRSIYRIVDRLEQNLPIDITGDAEVCYTEDIVDFYDEYTTSKSWNTDIVSTIPAININLSRLILKIKEELNSTSEITVKLNNDEIDIMNEVLGE